MRHLRVFSFAKASVIYSTYIQLIFNLYSIYIQLSRLYSTYVVFNLYSTYYTYKLISNLYYSLLVSILITSYYSFFLYSRKTFQWDYYAIALRQRLLKFNPPTSHVQIKWVEYIYFPKFPHFSNSYKCVGLCLR